MYTRNAGPRHTPEHTATLVAQTPAQHHPALGGPSRMSADAFSGSQAPQVTAASGSLLVVGGRGRQGDHVGARLARDDVMLCRVALVEQILAAQHSPVACDLVLRSQAGVCGACGSVSGVPWLRARSQAAQQHTTLQALLSTCLVRTCMGPHLAPCSAAAAPRAWGGTRG